MQTENPTPNEGASIQERLESYLGADEPQAETQADEPQEIEAKADPAEEEVETEDDEEAGDEPQLSLTDLAKYLGVDENALDLDESGALNLKTKVDGQEGKAKLADLLTSYQLRSHLDNQTRAVAEKQKAMQAQEAQMEQAIQARVQHVEDMANAAQSQLLREFNNIDWQTLRVTDPAEYAAQYQDFQARQAYIGNITQQAQQQRQQHDAQSIKREHEILADLRQRSADVIGQAIPEWSAPEVRQKEVTELSGAIRGEVEKFFGPEADRVMREIDSGYYGPMPIIWARKAMLYDRMQESKAAVENKVRAAPKLVKPGQSTPRNSTETTAKNIKAEIRKSGGKRGIADYLLATGKV